MGHFITVSLVELMEKKMVFGTVGLRTSLAVIITNNKAVGRRRPGKRREETMGTEVRRRNRKKRTMSCQCLCNKDTLYVIVPW